MNTLPVSKKVYSDISERINTTLSFSPYSAAEAMHVVDAYLAGEDAVSEDAIAMLAFNMIKAELDRAMVRSTRARERAEKRRKKQPATDKPSVAPVVADTSSVTEAEETSGSVELPLSRRERRAIERSLHPKSRKWKRIG